MNENTLVYGTRVATKNRELVNKPSNNIFNINKWWETS